MKNFVEFEQDISFFLKKKKLPLKMLEGKYNQLLGQFVENSIKQSFVFLL